MTVTVELFTSGGCPHCARAMKLLTRVGKSIGADQLVLQQVDVVKEIDHAVALGVLSTPAVAVDGELLFTSLPSEKKLYEELLRRVST